MTRTWLSSGAGLFAQELVAGLVHSGAKVTFVAPEAENQAYEAPHPRLRRLRPPRERRDNSPRLVRGGYSMARVFGSTASLLRARFTNRVFIVSIPEPLVFGLPALALLWFTGARLIFVAHDPVPHAWKLPPRFRELELWMHKACYRLASATVVLSEPSAAKIRSTYPDFKGRVEVIEHGVFLLKDPSELPGRHKLLLFGTLRRNKGVREAIEGTLIAASRGANVSLIVAGEPHNEDASYWHDCETLARAAPETIRLEIGYVQDDALDRLFRESDALLMPYREFFSQSGVALLAASNARPIVASMAGGIGSLIEEGMPATVIQMPITAQSVASAIEAFFAVPADTWRTRAASYRELTMTKRSWDAIGQRYRILAEEIGA
jgi:glycosyltransferase involved in cell wall biosynthesis